MFEKYINKECDVYIMGGYSQTGMHSRLVSGNLIAVDNESICLASVDYKTKRKRETIILIKNILEFHAYE